MILCIGFYEEELRRPAVSLIAIVTKNYVHLIFIFRQ